MKGTIFVEFLNIVEREHGLEMVDAILDQAGSALATGGAYTTVGNYPHEELFALVGSMSELSSQTANVLLEEFAGHLISVFQQMHPEFFDRSDSYLAFLESVETHIHKEVLKLYPDAAPPSLVTKRLSEDELQISYRSHRPLAAFAESLSRQGARLFETEVLVETLSTAEDGRSAEIRVRVQS